MSLKSNLPDLLKGYMKEHGISQYELGERIGMRQGAVNRFIRNGDATLINLGTIEKISKLIPLDYGNLLIKDETE